MIALERRGNRRLFLRLLLVTITSFVMTTLGTSLVVVRGDSMTPTLRAGEVALVPRYETWLHRLGIGTFRRGDIVFFRSPVDRNQRIIKRIVASPGDQVALVGGNLYIDGQLVHEPYLKNRIAVSSLPKTLVANGHVFVLGDNRGPLGSLDSRQFGQIAIRTLEGRVAVIVWPLFTLTNGKLRLNVRTLTSYE